MDAQTFLDNFATIADAPGGVQRLRDLTLDFAVSGRLVRQDSADEPAADLLDRIESDQARLVAEGNARPNRAHSPRPSEGPLPLGWCWASMPRLGFINPRNVVEADVVAGFVPMPLVPTDIRKACGFQKRKWSEISKGYTHVADGDVAIAKITPCFQNGKSAVFSGLPSGLGAATTELYVVRPTPLGANPRFLHLVLRSPAFILGGMPEMTGTAGQQRLPRQYFTDTPIPLPPLSEQNRIVAKVDELMGQCDELESRQERRQRATTRFRGSALHALTEAETPDDFRLAWERVSINWPALTDHPDSISALRHTILGLAVAGRLVGKSLEPCDDDGESLLNRIRSERGELIRAGDLRRPRAAAETNQAHWPSSVPLGWTVCALEEIGALENTSITDGPFGSKLKSSHYVDYPGHRVLRLGNVRRGFLDLNNESYISAEHFSSLKACHLRVDDLLVASLGNPSGRTCIVTADALPAVNKADCFRVRLHPLVSPGYVSLVLNSPQSLARAAELNRGDTRGRITLAHLKATPIPLPALHVQRSIVEGVEHFLNLCNRLEAALELRVCEQTATASGLVRIA